MAAKLTDKQRTFVAEYLVDLNATQAAIRAGYSVRTAGAIGEENLRKPEIQAAIAEAQAQRAQRTEISQDYVLANLVEVTERCMRKWPVRNSKGQQVQDADGNNIWAFNAQGANRALELIGKHLGMFKERVEHSGKDGAPIAVEHGVSPAVEAVLKSLREVTA